MTTTKRTKQIVERELKSVTRELNDSISFEQQIKANAGKRERHRVTLHRKIAQLNNELKLAS